ncbi:DUF167 domain-containing protein [Candidatus Woesearchaeota archaeon]|nr:DUF167 domain-containing protein [Candidatus Woesearchaeota archaeon]
MDITKYISNNKITLRATPNASQTRLIEEDGKLKLYIKAVPEDNKANKEIIAFFKKEFKLKVVIDKGEKGRDKVLKVIN